MVWILCPRSALWRNALVVHFSLFHVAFTMNILWRKGLFSRTKIYLMHSHLKQTTLKQFSVGKWKVWLFVFIIVWASEQSKSSSLNGMKHLFNDTIVDWVQFFTWRVTFRGANSLFEKYFCRFQPVCVRDSAATQAQWTHFNPIWNSYHISEKKPLFDYMSYVSVLSFYHTGRHHIKLIYYHVLCFWHSLKIPKPVKLSVNKFNFFRKIR